VVAEARAGEIGPALRRLEAQGATPVGLCIATARHFRALYAVASDPEGPDRGAGRLRPPVNFKRRDGVIRQAKLWGPRKLEDALHLLTDTDLALRSSAKAPQMAVMERMLVRLSMLAQR
jgi:DNA polymerase-3 subunit delta